MSKIFEIYLMDLENKKYPLAKLILISTIILKIYLTN